MSNKIFALLKISYRKISRKKTRTLISMLILCISTILVVGFGSIINTFVNGLNDFGYVSVSGIKATGYFKSNTENSDLYHELSNYSNDIAIKKSYLHLNIENADFDLKTNSVISVNQSYLNSSPLKIVQGRLPQNKNEITLPRKFENLYNQEISINDNENKSVTSFNVVGLYDVLNGNENFEYSIIDLNTPLSSQDQIDYYVYNRQLNNDMMHNLGQKYDAEYINNPYAGLNVPLYVFLGILLIFLLVFSLLKNINTIFEKLDYEENKKLKYIGVQKQQLFFLNLFYSLAIGIFPILLGNIMGIILYKSTMPKILSYTDFSGLTQITINYKLVAIASLTIFILYFLTLNFHKQEKENKKTYGKLNNIKKKTIEEKYSARSIILNKKKYLSIIISLTITLSLLTTIIVTTISLDPLKHAQNNNMYDLQVKGTLLENGIDTKIIEEPNYLATNKDLKYELNYKLTVDTESGKQSYIVAKINKNINSQDLPTLIEEDKYLCTVSGLGPEYFKYISNKYQVIGEQYSDLGIIYYRQNNTTDNINLGDTITLEMEINGEVKKIEEKVMTIITDKNSADINYDPTLGIFNFSSTKFAQLFGPDYISLIGINSENKSSLLDLEKQLNKNSEYDVQSYDAFKKIIERFKMFLISFGICGALLLLINSLLNIICTQISNCVTRNKEFATLEAIGCTDQRIKHILIKEGNYYLLRSYFFSFITTSASLLYIKSQIAFSDKWLAFFIVTYVLVMTSIYFINRLIIILNYNSLRKIAITKRIHS